MPLGFERLNERTKRPNELINFIKPLPGPDEALARDFLERVAAVCYPIMKRNHIAVMSLEEYEPNREFIGRNFNNGEVIQLVLKAPSTGQWVPFKHVQMVMMHELAHCKQMNHSKAFWKVRDVYAEELRGLWAKNYTGEGLWGRGQTLLSGQYDTDVMPEAIQDIDRLCGGTFRSRGRKRKREKPQLTYAEKKQRRIAKKFGKGGVSLGADEEVRTQLEGGKKVKGKPRVAKSARGRELRAAAALARFDSAKKEEVKEEPEEDIPWSETESEGEDVTGATAIDTDGSKMTDGEGRDLVNVCGAEDPNDDDVKREMRELFEFGFTKAKAKAGRSKTTESRPADEGDVEEILTTIDNHGEKTTKEHVHVAADEPAETPKTPEPPVQPVLTPSPPSSSTCGVCSLSNAEGDLTCAACSNVLIVDEMPNNWRCDSDSCSGLVYRNAGDCGVCGLCGGPKPFSIDA
ncbi:WLM-domain-containing protein [Rhizodiscina lignyota]|uniref:WLM-domain-containing protein n=1 Tax=Rhizodiscina lignyota TaxID=1504668 RepID=A0A9P4IA80_9PEZI|nr:WLM-domain-containing protein [Rhizodiscina lignyota]